LRHEDHDLDLDLIRDAASGPIGPRKAIAIRVLGDVNDNALLHVAIPLVDGWVPSDDDWNEPVEYCASWAADALGELSTPEAVEWARDCALRNDQLGTAALHVLLKGGERRDEELMSTAYEVIDIDDFTYDGSTIAEEVRKQNRTSLLPVVRDILRRSAFDYSRRQAVETLIALDPAFPTSDAAVDLLWDASSDVHHVIKDVLPNNGRVARRLEDLEIGSSED
jgi:hypothetical protein